LNNYSLDKLQSESLKHFPNVNSLLKISLGLVFFTIISSALVYAETISVDIEGNSFDVEYSADQVVINSIIAEYEPANDYAGLIIGVEVTGNSGTLDFIFERAFFDSIFEGVEDDFFILIDGDFADFTEIKTAQSRSLSIEVPSGSEDIEIIGTVFGNPAAETEETTMEETMEEETMEEETMEEETMEEETMEEETLDEPAETVEETPKTQCGPGTILKNGACVLDERCGPGTVLKDGACVLESAPKSSETSVKGMGKELITGIIAALVISIIIIIILGAISKASKSKD